MYFRDKSIFDASSVLTKKQLVRRVAKTRKLRLLTILSHPLLIGSEWFPDPTIVGDVLTLRLYAIQLDLNQTSESNRLFEELITTKSESFPMYSSRNEELKWPLKCIAFCILHRSFVWISLDLVFGFIV